MRTPTSRGPHTTPTGHKTTDWWLFFSSLERSDIFREHVEENGNGLHAEDLALPRADVDHLLLLLLRPEHEDVVVLRDHGVADLLLELVVALVHVHVVPGVAQLPRDPLPVLVEGLGHGHDGHLARREPQGPLAAPLLAEDGEHALDRPEDGPVDDDRFLHELVRAPKLEPEPDRQLEVELHRGALVPALERVLELDVDLRPVERAVSRVELPLHLVLRAEALQALAQLLLGLVPHLDVADVLVRARGELQVEREAHGVVHVLHELERALDLGEDLVLRAEDVRVVLLEPPDAREARERAGGLVAVQHAEVGEAHREVLVRAGLVLEHQAVAGAVHGLHAVLVLVDRLEQEHVLAVVLVVPRGLPQVAVVDVGRDHLREAALAVAPADEGDQLVVDPRPVREEEAGPGRHRVEEEQPLLLADLAVIVLCGLLQKAHVLLEGLLVREGDPVNALHAVVLRVALPVRGGVLREGEGLHQPRVRDVWARAEVDEGAAPVRRCHLSLLDLLRDEDLLEFVELEHLQGLLLREHKPLEGLLLLDDTLDHAFKLLEILLADFLQLAAHEGVVVEPGPVARGRPDREVAAILELHSLSEHVRGGVPERIRPLIGVELEDLEVAILLQRPRQIPGLPVHLRDRGRLRQPDRDFLRDF
mmetsp:Transcript_36162/g.70286  ORF Transcript_36162/g.70286 Transcript_36162/m.70286 type:complete len:649 (+) Transcript_36162:65-2011(+)